VGPILDLMAVVLENISSNAIVARMTVSAVFRSAQITAHIPNLSYHKKASLFIISSVTCKSRLLSGEKIDSNLVLSGFLNFYCIFQAFPEGLFHQLLLAMTHPDHATRVGSHRVFYAILMPSMVCPWSVPLVPSASKGYDSQDTLLVALSGFSSSGAMLEKMRKESASDAFVRGMEEDDSQPADANLHTVHSSHIESHVLNKSPFCAYFDGRAATESGKEVRSVELLVAF